MEEEEMGKIARDQRVIRIAARGIALALQHRLSKEQLARLIEIDDKYMAEVGMVCGEMVTGVEKE